MSQNSLLYDILVELNCYQGELLSKLSQSCQTRKNKVSTWYNSLPMDSKLKISRIDASKPLVNDFCGILQHLLISEPRHFERSIGSLSWHVGGDRKIKFVADSFRKYEFRSVQVVEREFLCAAGFVWDGMRLVDINFANISNLLHMMQNISKQQCFVSEPSSISDVYCISWLRRKTRFSLAQLLVALLELNIWRHWQNRTNTDVDKYAIDIPPRVTSMRTALERIAVQCGDADCFRALVETQGRRCMHQLLVSTGDNRISLYLTIMKKRLGAGWYNCCSVASPSHYTPQIKALWVLAHLVGVMHDSCHRKFVGSRTIVLEDPMVSAHMSTSEVIRGLLTIPLLDSFSFVHELRANIRDSMISDFAFADLLSGDKCVAEGLGRRHDAVAVQTSQRSKRAKKKRGKRSVVVKHESSVAPHSAGNIADNSLFSEPSPRGQDNRDTSTPAVYYSHSVAPSAVTDDLIATTRVRVIVSSMLDCILYHAFEVIDSRAVDHAVAADGWCTDDASPLHASTRPSLAVSSLQEIAMARAEETDKDKDEGSGAGAGAGAGAEVPVSDGLLAPDGACQSFPRWISTEGWVLSSGLSPPTSPSSASSRFGGLFGRSMVVKREADSNDDSSSFFRSEYPVEIPVQKSPDYAAVAEQAGRSGGMCRPCSSPLIQEVDKRDSGVGGGGGGLAVSMSRNEKRVAGSDILALHRVTANERRRRYSHDFASGSADTERRVAELTVRSGRKRNLGVQHGSNVTTPATVAPSLQLLPLTSLDQDRDGSSDPGAELSGHLEGALFPHQRGAVVPCWEEGDTGEPSVASPNVSRVGATSRRRATSANSEPRSRQKRSLSPSLSLGDRNRRDRERLLSLESRVQCLQSSSSPGRGGAAGAFSPDDSGSLEGLDADSFSSGFGFGLEEFDSMLDSDGFGADQGTAYYDHLPINADWGTPLSGRSDQRLILAISCSCLRSQAESASLRNFVALQRSLIALRPQPGVQAARGMVHITPPYYDVQAMGMYHEHPRRQLEVLHCTVDLSCLLVCHCSLVLDGRTGDERWRRF
jgi:hypothetical protein